MGDKIAGWGSAGGFAFGVPPGGIAPAGAHCRGDLVPRVRLSRSRWGLAPVLVPAPCGIGNHPHVVRRRRNGARLI